MKMFSLCTRIKYLLILLPGISFSQNKKIKIDIALSNLPNHELFYLHDGNYVDSQISKNGRLNFVYIKKSIGPQGLGILSSDKKNNFFFYIENKNIQIRGSFGDLDNLKFSGSQTQKDYVEFLNSIKKDQSKLVMAKSQLNRARQLKSADTSKFDFIPIQDQQLKKKKIDFIVSHPASYIGSTLLSIETRGKSFTTEETLELFSKLSKEQQNSENGEIILKSIGLYKETKIGDQAPSFRMKDEKNKEVTMDYYKGKTVLLLFWASWCGPCRAEAPYFKEVYEKYKNTGFEIIAVSLDDDESKWKNFIKTGQFTWINISDLKGWANEVALIYGVTRIPDSFLIDGQGKIIGRDLSPKQLEKSLEALKN